MGFQLLDNVRLQGRLECQVIHLAALYCQTVAQDGKRARRQSRYGRLVQPSGLEQT